MDLTGAPAPCPTGSSLLEDSVKYLIVEDFSGQPVPFLFPRRVDHADMFEQLPYGKVLAAGYAELGPDGFVCYGGNAEPGQEQSRITPRCHRGKGIPSLSAIMLGTAV